MDREKAIRILTLFREEWDRHSKTPNAKALDMAIEALQEKEQIIKQLEELRDDPIMHCSEDYWEGHYIAAKEAIAIVRGEEE